MGLWGLGTLLALLLATSASHVQGCRHWEFGCSDGECINAHYKCNGWKSCEDGSDETTEECGDECEKVEGGGFACSDGLCVRESEQCDGLVQCGDGSDETTGWQFNRHF